MIHYDKPINQLDPRNFSVPLGSKFMTNYTPFEHIYRDQNYYYYYNPSQNFPFFSPIFPSDLNSTEIKKISPMFEQTNYFYGNYLIDSKASPLSFLNDSNYYRTDIMSNQMNNINKSKQFLFR